MATYYYDSVNGNDANPGTIGSPKQTYTSVGTVVGDRFLFKAGTTQTFPSMATARSGSSDSARSYFGVYGASAQATYVTFRVASGAIILNGAGSKYITFEDIYFDMTNPGAAFCLLFVSKCGRADCWQHIPTLLLHRVNSGVARGATGLISSGSPRPRRPARKITLLKTVTSGVIPAMECLSLGVGKLLFADATSGETDLMTQPAGMASHRAHCTVQLQVAGRYQLGRSGNILWLPLRLMCITFGPMWPQYSA